MDEKKPSNVVQLKAKLASGATKIQFSHTIDGPIIETTLAENLIIRKFLTFALQDVEYQLEMVKKSGITKKKLEENTFVSGFITQYLKILLEEVDIGIKSVHAGEI